MFNKEAYSDATVSIHGMKLHAHRFVICVQSQYFENAFKDKFLEGDQRSIEFKDGSAMAHLRVFYYLYSGDYSETSLCNSFEGGRSRPVSSSQPLILAQMTQSY
jgi:hypothetical protein